MATRIGEAGNTTFGFALRVLGERGFRIERTDDEYRAMHPDGTLIFGSSPLILLGLLGIVDHFGDHWYHAPRGETPEVIDVSND